MMQLKLLPMLWGNSTRFYVGFCGEENLPSSGWFLKTSFRAVVRDPFFVKHVVINIVFQTNESSFEQYALSIHDSDKCANSAQHFFTQHFFQTTNPHAQAWGFVHLHGVLGGS